MKAAMTYPSMINVSPLTPEQIEIDDQFISEKYSVEKGIALLKNGELKGYVTRFNTDFFKVCWIDGSTSSLSATLGGVFRTFSRNGFDIVQLQK